MGEAPLKVEGACFLRQGSRAGSGTSRQLSIGRNKSFVIIGTLTAVRGVVASDPAEPGASRVAMGIPLAES